MKIEKPQYYIQDGDLSSVEEYVLDCLIERINDPNDGSKIIYAQHSKTAYLVFAETTNYGTLVYQTNENVWVFSSIGIPDNVTQSLRGFPNRYVVPPKRIRDFVESYITMEEMK